MEFVVQLRNALVGCGLLDAPPKIGTIFGFSEGKYKHYLLYCDFAMQNHRRVKDAAPYGAYGIRNAKPTSCTSLMILKKAKSAGTVLRICIEKRKEGENEERGCD